MFYRHWNIVLTFFGIVCKCKAPTDTGGKLFRHGCAPHLHPTDGPDSGKVLRLERWQRLLLTAIEDERKPIVSLRAASQVGKTLLALGVGLRAAVDGRGVLLASSTEVSARDLSRRVDGAIGRSAFLSSQFPSARSGPGARASWKGS